MSEFPGYCTEEMCEHRGHEPHPTEQGGIRLSIYKDRGRNYSNGGLSSKTDEVTLVGPGIRGPFKPTPESPAVKVVTYNTGSRKHVHIEPVEPCPAGYVGYMAGGSYVATTDSRFSEATGFYGAVSFHDRTETPAEYEALSR